jgi:hypothetical protein
MAINFMVPLRAAQGLFAILVLALNAYGTCLSRAMLLILTPSSGLLL